MMMRMRWIWLGLGMLAGICLRGNAQTVQDSPAQPDEAYMRSKQYFRVRDQGAKRDAAGHRNMDWARWTAWRQSERAKRSSAMPEPWRNYGPDSVSGRMISIAFHPTDSATYLTGSAAGGLWRTTDYGQSYDCLTDNYPSMGVGAVAYNPQNPNSILIATGEGYNFGGEFTAGFGILISHDGGQSWDTTSVQADLSQSFAGMDIIWHPTDTQKVSVATSFGMYYSADGGETYTYVLDRLPARMAADPQNPDRIYLAARYYNSQYPGGFYFSTNAGASWNLVGTPNLPALADIGYSALAVHPVYNHILYLSVGVSSQNGQGPLEGLFRSTDYGMTWTEVVPNIDYLCYHPPYQSICQGWFAHTLLIDPADTNHLYAGGTRLWESFDGGLNWTDTDLNLAGTAYAVHPDHHQTVWHPITGDLFDVNDGGVNYSRDMGSTWNSVSDGLVTHQFYSIAFAETDPDVVIAGAQDVGTFSTQTAHTAGKWDQEFSGDSFGHVIDHQDANTWYAINFMNYRRRKSDNAGFGWYQINAGTGTGDQWRMPIAIHPQDPQILLSSDDNAMYRSLNGGASWSLVSTYGYIEGFAFDPTDPSRVFASRLYGWQVYRSLDGGQTWAQLSASPGSPITDLHADPKDSGVLYATVGSFSAGNQLFRSTNGGLSWMSISSGLPEVPANTVAVDPYDNTHLYLGNDLGVWYSDDQGLSWSPFNDSLPVVVVEDLHYYKPDSSIRIGTYGRGYWRTRAMPPTPSVGMEAQLALQWSLSPNPTSGIFECRIEADQPVAYALQVSDVAGRNLFQDTGRLSEGENHLRYDWNQLSPGLYFLVLQAGAQTLREPLLIRR